jgi:hypothetical protein
MPPAVQATQATVRRSTSSSPPTVPESSKDPFVQFVQTELTALMDEPVRRLVSSITEQLAGQLPRIFENWSAQRAFGCLLQPSVSFLNSDEAISPRRKSSRKSSTRTRRTAYSFCGSQFSESRPRSPSRQRRINIRNSPFHETRGADSPTGLVGPSTHTLHDSGRSLPRGIFGIP